MRHLAFKQYSKKIILNVFIITSQTDESESFGLVPRLANWMDISTLAVWSSSLSMRNEFRVSLN